MCSQVPIPVVVMSPQYFKVVDLLSAGSTTIYLTNVGLITANDVTLTLPSLQVRTSCHAAERSSACIIIHFERLTTSVHRPTLITNSFSKVRKLLMPELVGSAVVRDASSTAASGGPYRFFTAMTCSKQVQHLRT